MESLKPLKLPEQESPKSNNSKKRYATTPEVFNGNPKNLQREHALVNATTYVIQTDNNNPDGTFIDSSRCIILITPHTHGTYPVIIKFDEEQGKYIGNFIEKNIPNNNTLSTRLLAPPGLEHIEHQEGPDICPNYNSSLRFIFVSRNRLFEQISFNSNSFLENHKNETTPLKFLPETYVDPASSAEKIIPSQNGRIRNKRTCEWRRCARAF